MSKELLLVVDAVANERGVEKDVIFDAMEAALASAAKKRYPDVDIAARVGIDKHTGEYETFRRWEVVADDVVMESPRPADPPDGRGRHQSPTVRSAIISKSRSKTPNSDALRRRRPSRSSCSACAKPSAPRSSTPTSDRVGELVTGVVKRVERGSVYLDLGGNAGSLRAARPRDPARGGAAPATASAATCTKYAPSSADRSCSFRARRRNS